MATTNWQTRFRFYRTNLWHLKRNLQEMKKEDSAIFPGIAQKVLSNLSHCAFDSRWMNSTTMHWYYDNERFYWNPQKDRFVGHPILYAHWLIPIMIDDLAAAAQDPQVPKSLSYTLIGIRHDLNRLLTEVSRHAQKVAAAERRMFRTQLAIHLTHKAELHIEQARKYQAQLLRSLVRCA